MLLKMGADGIACDGTRELTGVAQTSDFRNNLNSRGALTSREL